LRSFSTVPVIILTAKGADTDRIQGLRLGADDYLPKPFNPDELVARIEAIRRRLGTSERREAHEVVHLGDITVDFKNHNVIVGGESQYLTRIEWLLLSQLINNAGRLMLYEELLTSVWGPEYRDDVQILRTWISRLRNKLERDPRSPQIIRTVPKTGYIIDSTEE
jgi:DNA-binding response OmpR family regulator